MPPTCSFERVREIDAESPTLIEGLPGMGLVASIAVEQVREHLDLDEIGHLRSDAFPAVASFEDGLVDEPVRVYGGTDPAVLTLQSSIPVPEEAVGALADCVLEELAPAFEQAIFLVGAPAQSEEEIGDVSGVASTEAERERLRGVGIELAGQTGAIGGPTGALLQACFRSEVAAVALIVRCRPKVPDPGAARAVIENGLERLVDFDLDTTDLQERDEEIQRQMEQVAHQFQQAQQRQPLGPGQGAGEAPESIYR